MSIRLTPRSNSDDTENFSRIREFPRDHGAETPGIIVHAAIRMLAVFKREKRC